MARVRVAAAALTTGAAPDAKAPPVVGLQASKVNGVRWSAQIPALEVFVV